MSLRQVNSDTVRELERNIKGRGEVNGHSFTQIRKGFRAYLYRVDTEEGLTFYEVFKRRENKTFSCISYPTSKAFGVWAWTTRDIERAQQRFEDIEEKETRKYLRKNPDAEISFVGYLKN